MTFSIYLYSTKYLICILSFRHIVCSTDFRSTDFRSKDSFRQIYFLQSRGTPSQRVILVMGKVMGKESSVKLSKDLFIQNNILTFMYVK